MVSNNFKIYLLNSSERFENLYQNIPFSKTVINTEKEKKIKYKSHNFNILFFSYIYIFFMIIS